MANAISFIANSKFTAVDDGCGDYTSSLSLGTVPPVMVGTAGDDVFALEAMGGEWAVYSYVHVTGYASPDGYGRYTDPAAANVENLVVGCGLVYVMNAGPGQRNTLHVYREARED